MNEEQKECLDPFQNHPKVCGLCDSVIIWKFKGKKKYHGKAFLYFFVFASLFCPLQKVWSVEKKQSSEATSTL